MKTTFTLLLTVLSFISFAQPNKETREEREERIKAHKIAFISTELDLNSKEAEKFWPVYNELEAEMKSIHDERRKTFKKLKKFDDLTEDEAYDLTANIFDLEAKETQLRSEYLSKFAAVVGKKKAAKVYLAEEKFKRELLKKLKKNPDDRPRGGGPGRNGPPPRNR